MWWSSALTTSVIEKDRPTRVTFDWLVFCRSIGDSTHHELLWSPLMMLPLARR